MNIEMSNKKLQNVGVGFKFGHKSFIGQRWAMPDDLDIQGNFPEFHFNVDNFSISGSKQN